MKHDIKESIQERWEHSAKGYSDGIQQDFDTKVVETWQNLILLAPAILQLFYQWPAIMLPQ